MTARSDRNGGEVDAMELLRRFCIDDPRVEGTSGGAWAQALDSRTAALVRLGALITASAPTASMRSAVDDAITAGVSVGEIIGVLDGMVAIAGLPRVVAAAPRIAAALGYDEELSPDDL
ncbi:carboxymuconolactone decarboxylase family protein [Microbacterium cremeum]|uniref:carboxymuconolactone decarboxylase family protein n=1 Tax=Microbacterium cremeum TaxID=2782169 RepID=UPI001887323E|nr:carboxymuconolactone decarboxylase family protein [Microbacterium cremeum]